MRYFVTSLVLLVAIGDSPSGTAAQPPSVDDLLRDLSTFDGPSLDGRGSDERSRLVREGGGNFASEKAVAAALKWFAAHQNPDGSWSFDHTRGPCQGRCPNPGALAEAPRAATAMALLPLLGAGQTHTEGSYRATVKNGLDYLVRNMEIDGDRRSLAEPEGKMYSHGLGSIVLCEAYAMTRDKQLSRPAQGALNHIAYAQDPVGGGWRYAPKQPGDTSVFGWQYVALRTGKVAGLQVRPDTITKASRFLDSVQANDGVYYGYTSPATGRNATTAIGLLCRMYGGWERARPALKQGVEYLSARGPSKANMYANYYATQVMRHYEGDHWSKWNVKMRDYLVATQSKAGHAAGSWHFGGGDHGSSRGGRVYCTSMAALILEVYYRHLPIYRNDRISEDDFRF